MTIDFEELEEKYWQAQMLISKHDECESSFKREVRDIYFRLGVLLQDNGGTYEGGLERFDDT